MVSLKSYHSYFFRTTPFFLQNNITSLRKKAFGRLPVVFHLGLSENQINNISVEVEKDFHLKKGFFSERKMSTNRIFRIFFVPQAYSGLLQLITLDLSKNNLTWVPPGWSWSYHVFYDNCWKIFQKQSFGFRCFQNTCESAENRPES